MGECLQGHKALDKGAALLEGLGQHLPVDTRLGRFERSLSTS